MIEKFNYETTKGGTIDTVLYKDGWKIDIRSSSISQREVAPAKDFFLIQKRFYKNGIIESRGKILGRVPFGTWEFFNENGRLIKKVDEDAKFGKIKPADLVSIIEKVGLINRETGENVITKSKLKTDGTFYDIIIQELNIFFTPAQYSEKGEEISPPIWAFGYWDNPKRISFSVNGNNGEYERHEKEFETLE